MIDALSMFFGPQPVLTPALVAGNLVLSCLLSLVFALVYQYTFRGFTYSRSYIHTMVIGSMVTCMLIMAVGNNLARGMGILGTLASLMRAVLRALLHPLTLVVIASGVAAYLYASEEQKKKVKSLLGM